MKDLTACRFFVLLQEDGDISLLDFKESFIEFRDLLVAISDSAENYISKFRALSDLRARLQILPAIIKKKSSHKILPEIGIKEYGRGVDVVGKKTNQSGVVHRPSTRTSF